jgi:hypothetical protein
MLTHGSVFLPLQSRNNGEHKSEGRGEKSRSPFPSLNGVLGGDTEWTVRRPRRPFLSSFLLPLSFLAALRIPQNTNLFQRRQSLQAFSGRCRQTWNPNSYKTSPKHVYVAHIKTFYSCECSDHNADLTRRLSNKQVGSSGKVSELYSEGT